MNNIYLVGIDCCGCRSCEQTCPRNCISMKRNEEGFIYPLLNVEMCINCGLCLKKCPIHNYNFEKKESKTYALTNKNKEELMDSASGGGAFLISKKFLEIGGIVYGVAYDKEFFAEIIRVKDFQELRKLQSSKYVFADTKDSYQKVKNDLQNNQKVLFIGTSCQVDGLFNYLGDVNENLYTISLICHGTPSPELFRKYLNYLEKKYKSKIKAYNPRFKIEDKNGYKEYILFENGKKIIRNYNESPYGFDFQNSNASRECCYNCRYCNTSRVGNIGLGDFWGIEKFYPDFPYQNGHSAVIVNDEKGEELFDLIKEEAEYISSSIEKVRDGQLHLQSPANRPKEREKIYKKLKEDPDFFKHRTPKKGIKYRLKKLIYCFLKK